MHNLKPDRQNATTHIGEPYHPIHESPKGGPIVILRETNEQDIIGRFRVKENKVTTVKLFHIVTAPILRNSETPTDKVSY